MRRSIRPRAFWLGTAALLLGACPADDVGETAGETAGTNAGTNADTNNSSAGSSSDPESTASSTPTSATGTSTTQATAPAGDTTADTEAESLRVVMETTLGEIVLELNEELAPVTTENFLAYVNAGFYDGSDGAGATIVHRVIPGFVVQGGGYTEALSLKPTAAPIVNEFGNGLTNVRGSISMARTDDPDSATSQFFLNLVDNEGLDDPPGYAVFGQIVEGLEVMDAIAAVPTNGSDVPTEPISILSTTLR